ncbi:MAG: Deoxyribodipyrimidine photo-lyase [Methanosaeta sp. PtaU1.Bin112]|nr:MAG: Deoxyribodipyrimidine photo-lyase [Methanosaeta sp. PtaU1.Bin112]
MPVNPRRIRALRKESHSKGPVIYWMSRDQRVRDNWALLFARELARKNDTCLAVAFCLVAQFLGATKMQYAFMLQGLKEVENDLSAREIPFILLRGDPREEISRLIDEWDAGALVCDFSPLRESRECKRSLAEQSKISFYEVDAHNIIPCWLASPKQEWAAYSFRPKVHRLLIEFLDEFPAYPEKIAISKPTDDSKQNSLAENRSNEIDCSEALRWIEADLMPEAKWIVPGEAAALRQLDHFLKHKLASYDKDRNNPNISGQSGLSAYLHFGQISAQRVALEVSRSGKDAGAFLEELIVRRELSDNYCYYNQYYDDVRGFSGWAIQSLGEHKRDRREYLYTLPELEKALTHDELWNAAQLEMLRTGKMHGYMRMYWSKKILEWTASPEQAQAAAIYLNDRYELDGRDPNGYAAIAWSLGGLHDRAWKEREIFGKVRYMSYNGAKRKFDVQAYIDKWCLHTEAEERSIRNGP